ncbi:MAG: inositol monophosphatase [Actinobacteria bacterium]|nr:inositol monophosphatase [Actinomycetota bacterium]
MAQRAVGEGASLDLQDARRVAVRAARSAGRLLRVGTRGAVTVRQKDPSGDLVSDLDIAAERLILDQLHAAFPDHRVVAEEGGTSGAGDGTWTWLVDPLDGTNNCAIGLSAYVVGLALCAYQRPVVGVVHDPVTGQTWSAVRHRGVRVGASSSIRSRRARLGGPPVLAWTQGHAVSRADVTARALKLVLESSARRVLQLWAPLLSWVMLVRGDIDGIVGYRPEVIDLPAGVLLALESGLQVRRLDGTEYDDRFDLPADARSFVAGSPENIDRLVRLVTAARSLEPEVRQLSTPDPEFAGW